MYQDYGKFADQNVIDYCRSLNVGDKIKFKKEKQRYTIKAKSDRYLICTKPFNLNHHVLYAIVDLKRYVRGPNNQIFNGYDYMVQDDIDQCLEDLIEGEGFTDEDGVIHMPDLEVSHRRCIELDVELP